MNALAGTMLGLLNGGGGDASSSRRSRSSRGSGSKNKNARPKAWESFDKHREWQYKEESQNNGQRDEVVELMDNIANSAKNYLQENGGILGLASRAMGGFSGSSETDEERQERRRRRDERRRGAGSR